MSPARVLPLFLALAAGQGLLPGRALGFSADLTVQLAVTFAPTDLRDDGNLVQDGYAFGTNTVNALTAQTYSASQMSSMQAVRFEYSYPGQGWTVIGTDSDASDSTYGVAWDVTGLPARNDYSLRAVAVDAFNNQDPGATFSNCVVNQ